ncbi:MAG: hypothetical protein IJC38_02700 [Erysipelotrichaceae bacterium]|nr:hypothetical protein [Erysipelotrichaceae bacterium]
MKKQMRLVIYLVLIVLFSGFLLWKEGWYIDREKCYKEYLRDIQLPQGELVAEVSNFREIHRVLYHDETNLFSVVALKKLFVFTHTSDSCTLIPFAESSENAFEVMFYHCNVCNSSVVVFHRNTPLVSKIIIKKKTGEILEIDEWEKDFHVFIINETIGSISGIYTSYDEKGNAIDRMNWG